MKKILKRRIFSRNQPGSKVENTVSAEEIKKNENQIAF